MHPPNPVTLPPPSDPLARFAPDLLLAYRWFTEAGKAELAGDWQTADEYRCRGEAIHDRIERILGGVEHDCK